MFAPCIKILRCSHKSYWYSTHIGEYFFIIRDHSRDDDTYSVLEQYTTENRKTAVLKTDCIYLKNNEDYMLQKAIDRMQNFLEKSMNKQEE